MMRTIDQLQLGGKRVFVRVDFDVPLDGRQRIVDDRLLRNTLPTLKHALDRGAKLIVASHLGNPRGPSSKESMLPVAEKLAELLRVDVRLADECVGDGVRKLVFDLRERDVLMLENLRFHPEEEANDPEFARGLASLCDVYVDDALGVAHQALASNVGMARHVAVRGAGLLLKREVEQLGRLSKEPPRPFVLVLGGAKLSEKQRLIETLLPRVDALLVGGATAYTFLRAQGVALGHSSLEESKLEVARQIIDKAKRLGVRLLLPVDHLCSESADASAQRKRIGAESIPGELAGFDIGTETAQQFAQEIRSAKTVLWNGPMGLYEVPAWLEGTREIASALAACRGTTVAVGRDTAAAVARLGQTDRLTHVSTGGAASLELIEGRELPGLKALE